MSVTDCHSKSIGSIVGLGHLFKTQYTLRHFLNLIFFGSAIADNTLLDLKRCIFKNGHTVFLCGKHYNSPCLTDIDNSFCIAVIKDLFGVSGNELQEIRSEIAGLQKGELIIKDQMAFALGMGKKYKKIYVSKLI